LGARGGFGVKVADLVRAMEAIAPPRFAAAWDNVGLLVGDDGAALSRVLLTIDCTREVVGEARRERYDAIVSYHPPIFDAQKRFVAPSVAFEAARAGIALYAPHTALDVADGGTNDVLADALGMVDRAPLRAVAGGDCEFKLVTFVPERHVDALSRAVFEAGAGNIGKYSACSFRTPGIGTFYGGEGASPVVGQAGQDERAPEIRVETVVPIGRVDAVVRALRAAHPYEEPAFDLVRLAPPPSGRGLGRVGTVQAAPLRAVIDRIKAAAFTNHVLVVGSLDRQVSRAAVCAGSGGDLLPDVIDAGADLFLTGELRHHDALRAAAAGLAVVCILHSTSERLALRALEARLAELLPGLFIARSGEDREPFVFA
jgi:dinuclear metal center YbgI/SA1388 family protein